MMKILDDDIDEREFEKEKEIRILNGKNSDDDDDEDVKKDGEEEDEDEDEGDDEDEDEDDEELLPIATILNSSSSTSKFGSFIFHVDFKRKRRNVRERESESALVMLSSVSESESNDDDPLVFELDNLGFPSCYKFCNGSTKEIVDSCNGIVCLYDRDHNDVSLWNPATGKFRILPKSITVDVDGPGFHVVRPNHLVAFGFDVETKDYKVMLLTGDLNFISEEYIYRVQVYSLSTDSWRLLESINHLPGNPFLDPKEGLYLNGSCFFMAKFFDFTKLPCFPESNRFIISLDLSKEIITPIQLPDHHKNHKLYLSYLGEKIALFTSAPCYKEYWMGGYEDFNIWVLNYEHGSSSSSSSSVNKGFWTKLHSFRIQIRAGYYNIPRGISNDGKLVLLQDIGLCGLSNKMKLYSLVTKEVKKIFLSGKLVTSNAYAYKPSLVSIIGGNGAATADRVIINGAEAAATADSVIRNGTETKGYRVIGGAMSLLFANLTTFVCLFLKIKLGRSLRTEN